MAKIVVAEFVSADGFIAHPDGNMDGFNAEGDTTQHMLEVQREWDCLIGKSHVRDDSWLGRRASQG